jgi:hypothetical protein
MPEREFNQMPGNEEIQWDTEERSDLTPKEGHIRDNVMYLTASLLAWMQTEWGGVLSHMKTSTDIKTGEVTVLRALEGEKGAVPLRRIGAQNAGEINFWRPLRKLNLKVPADRQFNVAPYTRRHSTHGTLFVFPINQRESVPRNLKEEAETQAAAAAQPGTPAGEKG